MSPLDPENFPDSIEAKCSECGHIWEYERHEALACPFCNARLEAVEFNFDKSYAHFTGRRWKQIIREERAKWQQAMDAPSAIQQG